ncbi:MAG: hypothetical protein WA162_06545 [Thermodesulfobacteriota bacterium]
MFLDALLMLVSIVLPSVTGFAIIVALDRKGLIHGLELAALSFGIGAGCLSFYMFFLGILGLTYSFAALLPYFAAGFVIIAALIKKKTLFTARVEPYSEKTSALEKTLGVIFLALITVKLFFPLFNVFIWPPYFDDAVTTWDFKAKVIFTARGLGASGSENFLGGGPLHYPLGTPLFKAWMGIFAGTWNPNLVHLYDFAIFASMIALFYANIRRHASFAVAAAFTYVLASIPLMSFHAHGGYADMATGYYLLASVLLLARWFQTGETSLLYPTAITTTAMTFTKNEGLALYAPAIVLTFLFLIARPTPLRGTHSESGSGAPDAPLREKIKKIAVSCAIFLALAGPWLIVKTLYSLNISGGAPGFHGEALMELAAVFFWEGGAFNILWCGAILILFTNLKLFKDMTFIAYFMPFALTFLATLAVFVFTSNYEWLYLRSTINRSFLIISPLLVFSLGIFTALTFSKEKFKKSERGE